MQFANYATASRLNVYFFRFLGGVPVCSLPPHFCFPLASILPLIMITVLFDTFHAASTNFPSEAGMTITDIRKRSRIGLMVANY